MKVDLSQKEMEYILFLINESVTGSDGAADAGEYTMEDLELMDKLESALRLLEIKEFGFSAPAAKNKHLN